LDLLLAGLWTAQADGQHLFWGLDSASKELRWVIWKAISVSYEQPESITGSRTCAHIVYVSVINQRTVVSHNIEDILLARHRAGATIEVNHAAISHLLHDGFVPQPSTVYRDVFAVSVDLRARIQDGAISFDRDFPFENRKSTLDGVPSTSALLACLGEATASACGSGRDVVLMLSSGLDSTSLAVAAKEAGRNDVLCVTYGDTEDHAEIVVARETCRRLGLRHEAHVLDADQPRVKADLLAYGASAAQPCADPAMIAVISLARRFATADSVILDGSGNDYYFWRPPRRRDLMKTWLGLGRFPLLRGLRPIVPMHFRRERILASPLELLLLNGVWLRYSESRRFHPEAVDTHRYWLEEGRNHHFAREEFQHCLKMIYMGPAAFMLKTRSAAQSLGAVARFPWTADEVTDYCFSLPEQNRFDRKHRKSKTIIREMLRDTIAYDAEAVGKHHFSFGKKNFLHYHLDFCREEILNCKLWSRDIEGALKRLTSLLERDRQTENALLSLFAISLWHNRWFESRLQALLRRPHQFMGLHELKGRNAGGGSSGARKMAS
jgi:asparagine synthetase B (glutamine-hydrolysing)